MVRMSLFIFSGGKILHGPKNMIVCYANFNFCCFMPMARKRYKRNLVDK